MSADNGIYILETNKAPNGTLHNEKEYRVKHLQAVENIEYDSDAPDPVRPDGKYYPISEYRPDDKEHCAYQAAYKKKYRSDDPDVHIKNAREMWKDCNVIYSIEEARTVAFNIHKEITDKGFPVEYGISIIRIDRVF